MKKSVNAVQLICCKE